MKHLALALALGFAFAGGAPALPTAAAAQAAADDERAAFRAAARTEAPADRVAAIRKFIAEHPASGLVPVGRQYIVSALVESSAPVADILKALEESVASSEDVVDTAMTKNEVAAHLAERGEMLDKAVSLANEALGALPADFDRDARASIQDTLGWAQFRKGDAAAGIVNLKAANDGSPDNQEILFHLGSAHEKLGETDAAIDAYVRSASVFLGTKLSAEAPLKALWIRKNGSEKGLAERLGAAREASRKYVIFDSRRSDQPAPAWELKDLAGKAVKLSDYRGKLVVMDFWGSWCPPCRAELPKFQALYDKYRQNPKIAFVSMNWERPGEPAARMKLVTDFMATNKYTFPVVIDHDRVAVEAYKIPGFPTVYMIDGDGTIRYRNVGYDEGVEQILEAQIESLLPKN